MIKFQNIKKIYSGETPVLDGISFEVKDGEFVSIVGKSGAGKTTLIRLLLGFEKPTSGQIIFNGKDINELKPNELQKARQKIGVVHQDYKLLPTKTVRENVAYIMLVQGREDKEIDKNVAQALEATGLSEKENSFPSELSGGEKQRLAVARALVSKPEVVVADEPTGNLDPYNTYEVISLLKKINESGKTVILASHDKDIINKLGKRVITLESGKIMRDDAEGRFIL